MQHKKVVNIYAIYKGRQYICNIKRSSIYMQYKKVVNIYAI